MGEKERNEKVVKLTEILRNREGQLEHDSIERMNMTDHRVQVDGEIKKKETTVHAELVRKDLLEIENKSTENQNEEIVRTSTRPILEEKARGISGTVHTIRL